MSVCPISRAAVVVGDLNLHLDIRESVETIKFKHTLAANNCSQHVESSLTPQNIWTCSLRSPTYQFNASWCRHRRALQPFVDRCPCQFSTSCKGSNDSMNQCCRSFDIDNFMGDFDSPQPNAMLQGSLLLSDTVDLFDLYFDTLLTSRLTCTILHEASQYSTHRTTVQSGVSPIQTIYSPSRTSLSP